ncbi:MAG: hypothetical protein JOZ52_12175, partial [Acidobacteria bacterium]|nr:hypothetical protein [Acidobacteriota bacterium]
NETEASNALATVFSELLADTERRRELASRALSIIEQNRGATERTAQMLCEFFDEK